MKVISIWQPFASLLVMGRKTIETRTWAAPASLIGRRIGIASTRLIRHEQRQWTKDPVFAAYYESTLLPPLDDLPCGYLLGTAILDSVEFMSEEYLEEVSNEEKAYGHWQVGNYAWRMTHPIALQHPVRVTGKQGIWDWNGSDAQDRAPEGGQKERTDKDDGLEASGSGGGDLRQPLEQAPALRGHLRVVSG